MVSMNLEFKSRLGQVEKEVGNEMVLGFGLTWGSDCAAATSW